MVALIVGAPGAPELWTLRALAGGDWDLHVVSARAGRSVSSFQWLRSLVRRQGVLAVASRLAGNLLIGRRENRRRARVLDRWLDGPRLRAWWESSDLEPITVPALNDPATAAAIGALEPDFIVRVSGGILKPSIFSLARVATLNIHHGMAPAIRGMWSIPWGIVEGRRDWIGATLHVIDEGIDTGTVVWRGSPQIEPGDTGESLFFRAHLEAVDALVACLSDAARTRPGRREFLDRYGDPEPPAESCYRSAPGLAAWLRYLALRRGARAPVTARAALE